MWLRIHGRRHHVAILAVIAWTYRATGDGHGFGEASPA
jgi:hypothetical protein